MGAEGSVAAGGLAAGGLAAGGGGPMLAGDSGAGGRMRKAERQKRILAEMAQAPSLRVGDLAARLGVSTETIRRDLGELTAAGQLSRTYGGAVRAAAEPGLGERHALFVAERERIARAAMPLIRGARLLLLGSGATTTHVARRIAVEMNDVTVITHGFGAATVLSLNPTIRVIVAPGAYHAGEGAMHGAQTLRFLEDFRADWAILGASGLTPEGPADALVEMAEVYAAMTRRAERALVAADHSKHGAAFPARYAPWGRIAALATDRPPAGALARALAAAGVGVTVG
jgi:DeoR/GlpR family transcriptional regulator of sugar metabolism